MRADPEAGTVPVFDGYGSLLGNVAWREEVVGRDQVADGSPDTGVRARSKQHRPEVGGTRTRWNLPCSVDFAERIRGGVMTNEATTPHGIGHPANVGPGHIAVVALDREYRILKQVNLRPGESRDWFYAPPEAVRIAIVPLGDCDTESFAVEYDTPLA